MNNFRGKIWREICAGNFGGLLKKEGGGEIICKKVFVFEFFIIFFVAFLINAFFELTYQLLCFLFRVFIC